MAATGRERKGNAGAGSANSRHDFQPSGRSIRMERQGQRNRWVYDALSYAPRLDLSVGPFNVTRERRDEDRALIAQRAEHPLMAYLRHAVMQQNHGGFF